MADVELAWKEVTRRIFYYIDCLGQSEEVDNLPDQFFDLYIFFVRFVDWAVSLA